MLFEDEIEGPCQNCGVRQAEHRWTGEASMLDVVHGAAVALWCGICVAEAQLEHCHKHAARIPALEAELAELRGVSNDRSDPATRQHEWVGEFSSDEEERSDPWPTCVDCGAKRCWSRYGSCQLAHGHDGLHSQTGDCPGPKGESTERTLTPEDTVAVGEHLTVPAVCARCDGRGWFREPGDARRWSCDCGAKCVVSDGRNDPEDS